MGGVAFTRSRCDADPLLRNAASAPHRLDGGLAPKGRRVCPPPARRRAPPSRRLPLKGGVILEPCMRRSYHSPLEGESQKPEPNGEGFCGGGYAQGEPKSRSCAPSRSGTRQIKGQRRDLVRRRGLALTGEDFCGGGSHKQRPKARSCAPSRVRTSQPAGEGRCGGPPTPERQAAASVRARILVCEN